MTPGNSRYKDYGSLANSGDQKKQNQAIPDLGLYRDDQPPSDDDDASETLARLQAQRKELKARQVLQSK